MKRALYAVVLATLLAASLMAVAFADFGLRNFRMSETPGGPATTQFPSGVKVVYVMFDYVDAEDMPIQVRVYDPKGQVIFQETKSYNGSGSVTLEVSLGEGVALQDGDYVTNVYTRRELYLTDSLEWRVGTGGPPPLETVVAIQVPEAVQEVGGGGGPSPLVIGGLTVLLVALLGLVVWALRGLLTGG